MCIFHSGDLVDYLPKLKELIELKDGDWRGFKFPVGFVLENLGFDFPIYLEGAILPTVEFKNLQFNDTADFSQIESSHDLSFISCRFGSSFRISDANVFNLRFRNAIFAGRIEAQRLNCNGDFIFVCDVKNGAQFNNAVFHKSALFQGNRVIYGVIGGKEPPSATEYHLCFSGEVSFQNVEFFQPGRVRIERADFSRAMVVGTKFDGVSLIDVEWPTGKWRRRAIYDDIWRIESEKSGSDFSSYYSYPVEHQYRTLRVSYEQQKNYGLSNDFYVGELETKRFRMRWLSRHLFSVTALYRFLSIYGTSPARAIIVFLGMILIYSSVSFVMLPADIDVLEMSGFSSCELGMLCRQGLTFFMCVVDGLQIVTLKANENSWGLLGSYRLLDLVFRIAGPIQLALIAMSIRNVIRRG